MAYSFGQQRKFIIQQDVAAAALKSFTILE